MVWAPVPYNGKFPLYFINKELEINAECYRKEILTTDLLPHADKLYLKNDWIFQ